MNIENAIRIDGAMEVPELSWLADQASKCQVVVEIGSLRGRSARAMADNLAGDSILFCVDHFRGSEEHGDEFFKDDNLYNTFLTNMKEYIESGQVRVLRCPSIEASGRINYMIGASLDMVFIDASHDYDSVVADIKAWKPLLKRGGLLSGHDHGHPPIERAVKEFAMENQELQLGLVPMSSIWYFRV